MLEGLSRNAGAIVGAKQVRRAIEAGTLSRVYLAADADPRVTEPIAALCGERGIPVVTEGTMRELGRACGIAVGAAVCALPI